jgi:hypothetical protein
VTDQPAGAVSAASASTDLLRQIQQLESENSALRARLARTGAGQVDDVEAPGVGPIFIGGTGRSGTWMVGRLLARHPDVVAIHTELRVHSSHRGGFRRVLSGEETPEEFARFAREHWFTITGPKGQPKGLSLIATSSELTNACDRMIKRAAIDPAAALGGFLHDLVDPYALGRGGRTWVETTPDNAGAADSLTQVFPNARVINIVRDGRDAAVSASSMPWGPNRPSSGLRWWASRVKAAHRAIGAADPDRVLTVRFEELVVTQREERFAELLDFVGLDAVPPVRKYFDQRVEAGSANIGRWRTLGRSRRRRIDAAYRRVYDRLSAEGVAGLPLHPDAVDALG